MPAEVIATILRDLGSVRGITVNDTCMKLYQLADDMTLFLQDNKSVRIAIQTFDEFYRYAVLKLSKSKTEAMIVCNDGSLCEDINLGILWINRPFKTLGTWLSLNSEEMIYLKIKEKTDIIKRILLSWQPHSLTLKGKSMLSKNTIIQPLEKRGV